MVLASNCINVYSWCGAQTRPHLSCPPAPLTLPGFLLHLPQTPPLPAAGPMLGALAERERSGLWASRASFSTTGDMAQTGGRPHRLDQGLPATSKGEEDYQEDPPPSFRLLSSPKGFGI